MFRRDACPLSFKPSGQFLRRFVVGVLGDEFALDGEGEDGFAEGGGGDGVGRVEEEMEVGGDKTEESNDATTATSD